MKEEEDMQKLIPGDLYVLTDNASFIPGVLCQRHRITAHECYFIGVKPPFRGKVIASSHDIMDRNSVWHVYDMHMEEIYRLSICQMHPLTIDERREQVKMNHEQQKNKNKNKKQNKKDDNSD